jgi:hypothetical protein
MNSNQIRAKRPAPWNKGKLIGQKAPLKLKEIWAIRIRLQLAPPWQSTHWMPTPRSESRRGTRSPRALRFPPRAMQPAHCRAVRSI